MPVNREKWEEKAGCCRAMDVTTLVCIIVALVLLGLFLHSGGGNLPDPPLKAWLAGSG